jgi:hypothetical protein
LNFSAIAFSFVRCGRQSFPGKRRHNVPASVSEWPIGFSFVDHDGYQRAANEGGACSVNERSCNEKGTFTSVRALVPVSIEEATMAIPSKTPLKSDDFPLHVDGDQIKGQDGKPIAKAKNPATAADVTGRLNEDEDRREEDKWSA